MTGVILAGGSGTRLWPLSREQKPKQFLKLTGELSLFQKTVLRIGKIVGDDILVVTTESGAEASAKQLEDLGIDPGGRVLLEPVGRNTAPAIGLAAATLDPSEIMVVLPSDHEIGDEEAFVSMIRAAEGPASEAKLVTFGIMPDSPETGYGYIRMGGTLASHGQFREVDRFVEKPDLETAREYLAQGDYVWNSGMFAFRADTLMGALEKFEPELHAGLKAMAGEAKKGNVPEKAYGNLKKISIDYAVMERSDKVVVMPVNPDWSDLGSFSALYDISDKNSVGNVLKTGKAGLVIEEASGGNLVFSGDKVVALIGMEDAIVIDTPDATLVCKKGMDQKVGEIVKKLKELGRDEAVRDT